MDTPFFPQMLADRFVMALWPDAPSLAIAQSGDNLHPTFGLWPVSLADDLHDFLASGERKLRLWTERHPCAHVHFSGPKVEDLELDPFFNINHPEDIEVAEAYADALMGLDS